MKNSLKILRTLIRETASNESSLNLVPHSEVVAAIDNAMRDERLNIDIPGFRDLMIEIAIVESGMISNGKLYHNNEMIGEIRGVFQLSPIALDQLRVPTAVPKTKERLDKSAAMQKSWSQQTTSDIFSSVKMQALAACMYVLWLYLNLAGEPGLISQSSRANFWKTYYNTESDELATVATFNDRLRNFKGKA